MVLVVFLVSSLLASLARLLFFDAATPKKIAKNIRKVLRIQKKALPLHTQLSDSALQQTLGYGVMVTLQILVLSFLVRVRVSQQQVFY